MIHSINLNPAPSLLLSFSPTFCVAGEVTPPPTSPLSHLRARVCLRALDDAKRRMGGNQELDKRAKARQRRQEAEAALNAVRARLNHKGRFQL